MTDEPTNQQPINDSTQTPTEPTPQETDLEHPHGEHDAERAPGVPTAQPQPADYEDEVDEASDDSFPASDPPSFTDSSATRNPGN